ncbi:hypothetical protein ACQ4PT_015501 [Festuca glaucescens]
MDKVYSFFMEEMAAVIMQIPVSRHGGDDFIAWPADKSGIYSVRSAYYLARTGSFFAKRCAKARGDSSDGVAQEKWWKMIWAINCPEKMKFVIWRMTHDCLPTGVQLWQRSIPAEDACVFCGSIVKFCYKSPPSKRCVSPPVPTWSPPPVSTVCVNVDAAVFKAENLDGWGAVIRDHLGSVLLAGHGTVRGGASPEAAEAFAMRQALEIAREGGFQKIVLASDCQSLIRKV